MKVVALLRGRKTLLRAPEKQDLQILFELRNDLSLQNWLMALPRPNSLRAVRAWLDRVASNEQRVLFIVGSPRSKRALGYCQLNQIDHVHGTADLGICLHEKARGRGHGEEAMGLLEQYGYQVLNLRKITLRVRSDNNRALAMYRRIGYREVGILVAHFCHGGTQHDVTLMEKFLS